MKNERFRVGDRVRVRFLDPTWAEADRWVLDAIGTVHEWHPEYSEWLVWIEEPGGGERYLWMFDDSELERAWT